MTPLELLVDGFASVTLASSVTLLLLGIAAGLSARAAAIPALVSFGVGVTTLSWLRFSGQDSDYPEQLVATVLLVAVVIIMSPLIRRPDFAAVAGGLLVGGAAAVLWFPSLGIWGMGWGQNSGVANSGTDPTGEGVAWLSTELAERGTASGLAWTALYLFGLLSPLWLMALAHHLTPDWILDRLEPRWSVVGGVVLVLGSFAAALNLFPELVEIVARRSEPAASQASPTSPGQNQLSPQTPEASDETG